MKANLKTRRTTAASVGSTELAARPDAAGLRWAGGLLLLMTLGVSALGLVATARLANATRTAKQQVLLADLYQDARFEAATADDQFHAYVFSHDPASLRGADQAVARLNNSLVLIEGSSADALAAASAVRLSAARYGAAAAKVEQLVGEGRTRLAVTVDREEMQPAAAQLTMSLSTLEESAHRTSQRHLIGSAAQAHLLGRTAPLALLGCLLVGAVSFRLVRRYRLRIEALATTDALTGLPNRLELAHQARRLLSGTDDAADVPTLLLLDLDHFKEVNDSLGHQYGDRLLIEVATRLRRCVKSTDVIARMGGDEFVVLLAEGGEGGALTVAERIRRVLEQPFSLDQLTVEVGVSIGIAVASRELATLPGLLRCADVAMYAAKEAGDGPVVFAADLDAAIGNKVQMMSEMRRALDHDELVLQYQPKVALDDGRLIGVEALVRWQHPIRGLLPPADFLPTVENTELMDRLTFHVLHKALLQSRTWTAAGHPLPIAVNIATRSLLNLAFPAEVARLLDQMQVPADMLCLEITETSAMGDLERCTQALQALRALGVKISIDDYGTGYCSMSYLQNLPVDELKIDRSFIARMGHDPQSAILARAIVEMGHNLGLTVVGEGVEDQRTSAMLRETGCDVAQGYHFARPMPPEEILSSQARRTAIPRPSPGSPRMNTVPTPVADLRPAG